MTWHPNIQSLDPPPELYTNATSPGPKPTAKSDSDTEQANFMDLLLRERYTMYTITNINETYAPVPVIPAIPPRSGTYWWVFCVCFAPCELRVCNLCVAKTAILVLFRLSFLHWLFAVYDLCVTQSFKASTVNTAVRLRCAWLIPLCTWRLWSFCDKLRWMKTGI